MVVQTLKERKWNSIKGLIMRKLLILLIMACGVFASCSKTTVVQGRMIASTAVSSASGNIDVLIQSDPVWYVRSLSGWITADESYHKGQSVVTLEYASNRSMEGDIRSSRVGVVVVCTHNGKRCDTLKIYQTGMLSGVPVPPLVQGIPGEITAEFPSQPVFKALDVVVPDEGEVKFSLPGSVETEVDGCRVYSIGHLRIVCGDCYDVDTLVEDTFWQESGAQWIYALRLQQRSTLLESLGFADCLRVFCGQETEAGMFVYASASVFDRITDFSREEGVQTGFTVYLQEE